MIEIVHYHSCPMVPVPVRVYAPCATAGDPWYGQAGATFG